MKLAGELIAVAAAIAVALLVERWATPWTETLKKKGLTAYQSDKIWGIAVGGSGWIAWFIIRPFVLDWLK
jgi:hypothetical protein